MRTVSKLSLTNLLTLQDNHCLSGGGPCLLNLWLFFFSFFLLASSNIFSFFFLFFFVSILIFLYTFPIRCVIINYKFQQICLCWHRLQWCDVCCWQRGNLCGHLIRLGTGYLTSILQNSYHESVLHNSYEFCSYLLKLL